MFYLCGEGLGLTSHISVHDELMSFAKSPVIILILRREVGEGRFYMF